MNDEQITAYVLDALSPPERAAFEAQMRDNPMLHDQVEEMRSFCRLLENELSPPGPPDVLTAEQRFAVFQAFSNRKPESRTIPWRRPGVVLSLLAACLALLLVIRPALLHEPEAEKVPSHFTPSASKEHYQKDLAVAPPAALSPAPDAPSPALSLPILKRKAATAPPAERPIGNTPALAKAVPVSSTESLTLSGAVTGSLTLSGTSTSSGAITNAGTGTMILSTTNAYSGGTTLSNGTITAPAAPVSKAPSVVDTYVTNPGITVRSGAVFDINGAALAPYNELAAMQPTAHLSLLSDSSLVRENVVPARQQPTSNAGFTNANAKLLSLTDILAPRTWMSEVSIDTTGQNVQSTTIRLGLISGKNTEIDGFYAGNLTATGGVQNESAPTTINQGTLTLHEPRLLQESLSPTNSPATVRLSTPLIVGTTISGTALPQSSYDLSIAPGAATRALQNSNTLNTERDNNSSAWGFNPATLLTDNHYDNAVSQLADNSVATVDHASTFALNSGVITLGKGVVTFATPPPPMVVQADSLHLAPSQAPQKPITPESINGIIGNSDSKTLVAEQIQTSVATLGQAMTEQLDRSSGGALAQNQKDSLPGVAGERPAGGTAGKEERKLAGTFADRARSHAKPTSILNENSAPAAAPAPVAPALPAEPTPAAPAVAMRWAQDAASVRAKAIDKLQRKDIGAVLVDNSEVEKVRPIAGRALAAAKKESAPASPFVSAKEFPRCLIPLKSAPNTYTLVKQTLSDGRLPRPEDVPLGSLIKDAPYGSPAPSSDTAQWLNAKIDITEAPWDPRHRLACVTLAVRHSDNVSSPSTGVMVKQAIIAFNPEVASSYRAIASLPPTKQEDSAADLTAGPLAFGEVLTRLYEYEPAGAPPSQTPALTLQVAILPPGGHEEKVVKAQGLDHAINLEQSPPNVRLAVSMASFGMLLQESPEASHLSWDQILRWISSGDEKPTTPEHQELISMIEKARALSAPRNAPPPAGH